VAPRRKEKRGYDTRQEVRGTEDLMGFQVTWKRKKESRCSGKKNRKTGRREGLEEVKGRTIQPRKRGERRVGRVEQTTRVTEKSANVGRNRRLPQ